MKRFLLLVILLSVVPRVYCQDLNRLRERAAGLWAARVQNDRAKALQYILPATRADFAIGETVLEARVVGFEFLETPSRVSVIAKTRVGLLPPLDKLEKSIAEIWEWTNGNWFLRAVPSAPNAFTGLLTVPRPGALSFKFELVEDELNLGQHKQGDSVSGTIHFKAPRSQVRTVRTRDVPGFSIKQPRWDADNNGGAIDFVFDTTLLSANAQLTPVLVGIGQAVGTAYPSGEDTLRLSIGIAGQIRVQQIPEVIDPRQAGRAEVQVQNVSDKPFSIKGIQSTSEVFKADGDVPPTIQPGQTIKLQIEYGANSQPVGGELVFSLSPGVLPGDALVFPLSTLTPQPIAPTGLTREQAEELKRLNGVR